MREFKVGDEVQATMETWPEEIQGLVGQVRVINRPRRQCILVCFPDLNEDEYISDSDGYGRNVWPMLPSELILITPVEDAQP